MLKSIRKFAADTLSNLDAIVTSHACVAGDVRAQTAAIYCQTAAIQANTTALTSLAADIRFIAESERKDQQRRGIN